MGDLAMQARRLLLLAPLALLGCQTELEPSGPGTPECSERTWLLCAYDGDTGDAETSTSVTTGTLEECGNGVPEKGEVCDDGVNNPPDPWTPEKSCIDCEGYNAYCGDGKVYDDGDANNAPEEVCDDGPDNTNKEWTPQRACKTGCGGYSSYCGDDNLDAGKEDCDDGTKNSDAYSEMKHCKEDCSGYAAHCGDTICQQMEKDQMLCPEDCMAMCGNGDIEPGEQCDDLMGNTDKCDEDCTLPACGDGFTNPNFMNEECDDGNMSDADDCVGDCKLAACGDGFWRAGVEECDDGNLVDDDTCSNDCVPARRVFVTAEKFAPEQLQGVMGADGICRAAAMVVPGLGTPGNTWLAWLSDDKSSPFTRIPPANKMFEGYYLLPTGAPVAKGWAGLTSGTLMNAINITEAGAAAGNPLAAWTNTLPNGTSGGADDCEDWSEAVIGATGGRGSVAATSEQWTVFMPVECTSSLRLYCVEVSP